MAVSAKVNIFVSGVTGYIDGAVLTKLLEHPKQRLPHHRPCVVHREEKAKKLKSVGVTPVIGSLNDTDLVHELSLDSDAVISMARANADHAPSVEATLSGQKKRFEKTGEQPILIHTVDSLPIALSQCTNAASTISLGQEFFLAKPKRKFPQLPPLSLTVDVDLLIVDADKEGRCTALSQVEYTILTLTPITGYVRTYIILPSTIYSLAWGLLVDIGVSNISIQIPATI
ncbi:hypothetical protein BDN71DRAFT_1429987 [Pleurotus eryngii]|uniref:NmrA-like domain-containing protein n=1 Tax=Pleurotus eryngii TaxID=5323 RepID=A0A9P6DH24_PLEER|nr:hypothetical protein BDN71DRAFT_1429987 [Pleurotus eryngii]